MLKKESKTSRYLIILWTLFIFILIFIFFLFVWIARGKMGVLPTFEELENPQTNLATEIYTDNGEILGKFYDENRTLVVYDDLSPYLIDALIATEDVRFKKHSGVDVRSLSRVAFKSLLLQQDAGGGSTISQQLAKNLFPRDTTYNKTFVGKAWHMVIVKIKEWITAVKLERSYTKNEILTMYLNTVPFGSDEVKGIKSASRTFFNTSPDSLSLDQAAILIGMLKAPTRYNPYNHPENAFQRRNVVIDQMLKYQYLNSHTADSVKQLPVNAMYKLSGHMRGNANHFRTFLRKSMTASKPKKEEYSNILNYRRDSLRWADDPLYGWVNKNPKPDGSSYDIYTDGLRIYTPVNMRMQEYAEQSMEEYLKDYLQPAFFREKEGRPNAPFENIGEEQIESIMWNAIMTSERYKNILKAGITDKDTIMQIFLRPVESSVFSWNGMIDKFISPYDSIRYMKHILRSGFMAMEPRSGHVKAYVGDHNYRYFQYDHVTQGRRQVGSTVKPFLYLLAMMEGVDPCKQIILKPITFQVGDTTWTPEVAGSNPHAWELVSLKWGLANSHNWVTAWLFKTFYPGGINSMISLMKNMGITSFIDPVPSMILGPSDISLVEMVTAYNTFGNQGINVTPVYVTRIENKYGNVITSFQAREVEAISEEDAYTMVELLKGVVNRGTAFSLRRDFHLTDEIIGKTGTTDDQSDGWFIGITPKLSAAVWVGCEDRSAHFDNIGMGAGGKMALPIWGKFFEKVYADSTLLITQEDLFEKPAGFYLNLDCPDISTNSSKSEFNEF